MERVQLVKRKPVIDLMVDSGAYSAFTQKAAVNLDSYCNFLLNNEEHISKSVCLDVINPQGPDVAAAAGWENYLYMRERGLDPMPVFHARESILWLDKMLDNTKYIGLSGTSLVSPNEHLAWYDYCWRYATDSSGCAIADFHAFGDTSIYSLTTFPWYSADSATWMIASARAGRVKLQGRSFQMRAHSVRDPNFISADDTGPKKDSWEKEIFALGLDPTIAMNVTASRSELAMIRSFLVAAHTLQLQELSRPCTKYVKCSPLVGQKKQLVGGHERVGPVKIYFVISPAAYYFNLPILAALKITRMLVSYFYIAIAPKNFFYERLLPFLYDPDGFCDSEPKLRRFYDKLRECLLKQEVMEAI